MNDSLRVRRFESLGDVQRDVQQTPGLDGLAFDQVLQRLTLHQLHDEEGLPFILLNVVNRADVRMIQRRRRARFALKTLQRLFVFRHIFRQKFQRDAASQPRILSLIDDAHSAAAQLLRDLVMRNRLIQHTPGKPAPVSFEVTIIGNIPPAVKAFADALECPTRRFHVWRRSPL